MQNFTSFILDRKTIQIILRNCSQESLIDLDMGEFKIYLKKSFAFLHFQNEMKI